MYVNLLLVQIPETVFSSLSMSLLVRAGLLLFFKKEKCKPICTAEQPYDQDPVEKYNTNGTAEQPYDQDPVRNVISSRTAEQLYDKDPVEIFDPGYLTRLGNN